MLDRGLEDDWFGSSFITSVAIVCGVAFVLMIPWEMTRRNPTIVVTAERAQRHSIPGSGR